MWYQSDFKFEDVPSRLTYHQWIAYLDESPCHQDALWQSEEFVSLFQSFYIP
eukprot:UN24275